MLSQIHSKWQEFIDKMLTFDSDSCEHNMEYAVEAMRQVGLSQKEIDSTICYFESVGGRCDCKIIANVIRPKG